MKKIMILATVILAMTVSFANATVLPGDVPPNYLNEMDNIAPQELLKMYEELDGQVKEIKRQFRRGQLTNDEVQDLIEHRNPFLLKAEAAVPARAWKTWKTIKLGTDLKTADDFRQAIERSGYNIGYWANEMLDKLAFEAVIKETELELIKVSLKELGFPQGATLSKIYQRAQELGLELCPAKVGPQLRLQYQFQPNEDWLIIAMEPIAVLDGSLHVFDMGDEWLRANYGDSERFWLGHHQWLFARHK